MARAQGGGQFVPPTVDHIVRSRRCMCLHNQQLGMSLARTAQTALFGVHPVWAVWCSLNTWRFDDAARRVKSLSREQAPKAQGPDRRCANHAQKNDAGTVEVRSGHARQDGERVGDYQEALQALIFFTARTDEDIDRKQHDVADCNDAEDSGDLVSVHVKSAHFLTPNCMNAAAPVAGGVIAA